MEEVEEVEVGTTIGNLAVDATAIKELVAVAVLIEVSVMPYSFPWSYS